MADKLMIVMMNADPQNAAEFGARFFQATVAPALDLWGNDLIPEIEETVGGAYVIQQAMDDRVVTFTY